MENQQELQEDIQQEVTIDEDLEDEDTYVSEEDGSEFKIEISDLERKKKHSRGMMDVSRRVKKPAKKPKKSQIISQYFSHSLLTP